jgi:glycosyltransferase involved in cell wall biosynthesis
MTNPVEFSVLMPVHAGASASYFEASLESLQVQSLQPTEIIVVEDGPLTSAHDRVLVAAMRNAETTLTRVRLARSVGIAGALQTGLVQASSDWIARMDADDIARPDRFAIQVDAARVGAFDVIGSAMTEFDVTPDLPLGVRRMPEVHSQIARRMKYTNPINHPTAFFRRNLAMEVGGYRPLPGLEDYDLWARMLCVGARFHNIDEPLVAYRVAPALFRRRRGRSLLSAELTFQRNLVRYGLIGWSRASLNLVTRIMFRLLPVTLMRPAYRMLFRSSASGTAR